MVESANHSRLDEVMLGLADPTRREILRRLANGEARVTDLARPFPISLNSVSKHIRLLERAGLVHRRKKGREHYLSFNTEPLAAASHWIAEQQALWTARLDALEALLRAEDRVSNPAGVSPSDANQADPFSNSGDEK